MEEYKDILWYEWLYKISNFGKVESLNYRNRWIKQLLKCIKITKWYLQVNLCKNKKLKLFLVHRLVLLTFKWNSYKPQVNHIDWNKINNKIENLEYCTASENELHKYSLWYKSHLFNKFWWDSQFAKKVKQLDLKWKLIKIWDSGIDIQRELGINSIYISNCCTWKQKTSWWFKFSFFKAN